MSDHLEVEYDFEGKILRLWVAGRPMAVAEARRRGIIPIDDKHRPIATSDLGRLKGSPLG